MSVTILKLPVSTYVQSAHALSKCSPLKRPWKRRGETGMLAFMSQPESLMANGVFFHSLFPKLRNSGFKTADTRSSYRRCSIKKLVLKISQYAQKNTGQSRRPATLSKRGSSKGVFLWILRNFQEHLFWKISTKGFRIFSVVKSAYSGETLCGDKNILFILGNYSRIVFRTLSNIF